MIEPRIKKTAFKMFTCSLLLIVPRISYSDGTPDARQSMVPLGAITVNKLRDSTGAAEDYAAHAFDSQYWQDKVKKLCDKQVHTCDDSSANKCSSSSACLKMQPVLSQMFHDQCKAAKNVAGKNAATAAAAKAALATTTTNGVLNQSQAASLGGNASMLSADADLSYKAYTDFYQSMNRKYKDQGKALDDQLHAEYQSIKGKNTTVATDKRKELQIGHDCLQSQFFKFTDYYSVPLNQTIETEANVAYQATTALKSSAPK